MTKATTASPRGWKTTLISPLVGLILKLLILLICLVYSLTLSAAEIQLNKILESFITFDAFCEHLVIQTIRLPRSLIAIGEISSVSDVIPISAFLGGVIVVVAKLLRRDLFAPVEIPCGVVKAAVGAPFFLYLLSSNRKK